jgi:hypothetical protein
MISPEASPRLDNYHYDCSGKNGSEYDVTSRQRRTTAERSKNRERQQLAHARVHPWRFHLATGVWLL